MKTWTRLLHTLEYNYDYKLDVRKRARLTHCVKCDTMQPKRQYRRKPMKSKELPHMWAHEQAPHGKATSAMSFDGPCFYSYGTVIGRIIRNKRGEKAYVLNAASFSPTTSAHQSRIASAIPSEERVWRVYDPGRGASLNPDGRELFDYAIKHAAEMEAKATTCRAEPQRMAYLGQSAKALRQAESVNAFFGLRRKVDTKAIERLAQAQAAAEHAAAKKREVAERENRAKWLTGEFNGHLGNPNIFRSCSEGIQSSMGVTLPREEFIRALAFVVHRRGRDWSSNGETCPVGQYQLTSITKAGVVAGCHRVAWSEVERLAAMLL